MSDPDEIAPPASRPRSPLEPRGRTMLVCGAVVVAAGVALVGTTQGDVGGVVLLVGWMTLALGIHRFGRAED